MSAAFVRATPLPVFLAGGLSAANVADAIATVRPYGLDLCSVVRTAGRLDPVKLRAFMRAVADADMAAATKLLPKIVNAPLRSNIVERGRQSVL